MPEAALEIADKKIVLPRFLIKGMIEYVRRQILSHALYDMDDVDTMKGIASCAIPALFIVSKDDKLVAWSNSQRLLDAHPHRDKEILFVHGDHNEFRDANAVTKIADFLANRTRRLKLEDALEILNAFTATHLLQTQQQQPSQQLPPCIPIPKMRSTAASPMNNNYHVKALYSMQPPPYEHPLVAKGITLLG